jgi:hypothetical protein
MCLNAAFNAAASSPFCGTSVDSVSVVFARLVATGEGVACRLRLSGSLRSACFGFVAALPLPFAAALRRGGLVGEASGVACGPGAGSGAGLRMAWLVDGLGDSGAGVIDILDMPSTRVVGSTISYKAVKWESAFMLCGTHIVGVKEVAVEGKVKKRHDAIECGGERKCERDESSEESRLI